MCFLSLILRELFWCLLSAGLWLWLLPYLICFLQGKLSPCSFLFAEQIKKYLCLSVCLPSCLPVPDFEFRHKIVFTKPMPVGHVVVLFVCQFFMTWSGIPRSFQKILLLWLKTTGLALHTKCQPVCLSMSFILRNFSDQSRHFLSTSGKLPRLKFCFPHILA